MPAIPKLDQAAIDRIVAGRATGQSFRQIATALGVDQSTVSRRVRRDPELRAAISAEEKRLARLTRDRERKARAKARRGAGVQSASRPEPEQGSFDRADADPPLEERQPSARPSRSTGVPQFASPEERFAYYETRRLDDPPYSILDSNAVRRGELPFAERRQQRRRRR